MAVLHTIIKEKERVILYNNIWCIIVFLSNIIYTSWIWCEIDQHSGVCVSSHHVLAIQAIFWLLKTMDSGLFSVLIWKRNEFQIALTERPDGLLFLRDGIQKNDRSWWYIAGSGWKWKMLLILIKALSGNLQQLLFLARETTYLSWSEFEFTWNFYQSQCPPRSIQTSSEKCVVSRACWVLKNSCKAMSHLMVSFLCESALMFD